MGELCWVGRSGGGQYEAAAVSECARRTLGVDDILHGDGYSVERAALFRGHGVEGLGLLDHVLRV